MITKLTKEQELQIPKTIEKWRNMASTPMNHKKAIEYTGKLYKSMGLEQPLIIFGFSPMNTILLCELFFRLVKEDKDLFKKLDNQLRSQIRSQLDSQLSSQLSSQLRSQLYSQLDNQLYSQLSNQLDSQLDSHLRSQLHSQLSIQLRIQLSSQLGSQLYNQLDSQLYSQLYNQLDNQLYNQLSSQLSSQLRSQIRSQLDSQLDSQLGGQLHSQLYSQLNSQLDSQLDSQLGSQLGSQLHSQLNSQLNSQLESQIYSQLYSQLDNQLYSQLSNQLDSQLRSHLRSQLNSQLDSQLRSQLDNQLGSQPNNDIIKSIKSNWYLGIFWLVWCGWYEYGKSIGVEFDNDKYDLFINFNSEVNFIIPYKNICFISEKPTEIHWNNNNLHKDGDMAVKYSDGYGMHFLNGVKVPEYLAMTPESNLDIDFFTKETNADIKAEFIRKYGIDRMKHLGKSVDKYNNYSQKWWTLSEYEVIDMSTIFTNIPYAPHLWMKNQTTGVYHLEAVHPDCKNIEQALKFRSRNRNINQYTTQEIR